MQVFPVDDEEAGGARATIASVETAGKADDWFLKFVTGTNQLPNPCAGSGKRAASPFSFSKLVLEKAPNHARALRIASALKCCSGTEAVVLA
jgi:hypothetical protein